MKFASRAKSFLAIAVLGLSMNQATASDAILTNGDFVDGKAHWKGDVKDASDADMTNITASMDNQSKASGMILTLKPDAWTSVSQVFNTHETALAFQMKYQASADFSETTPQSPVRGQAYFLANLSTLLGIPLQDDSHSPHPMMGMNASDNRPFVGVVITDPAQNTVFYRYIPLPPQADGPQTAVTLFTQLLAHEEKNFYLFFPPGQGTITFSNLSLTKAEQATGQPASPNGPGFINKPFVPGAPL